MSDFKKFFQAQQLHERIFQKDGKLMFAISKAKEASTLTDIATSLRPGIKPHETHGQMTHGVTVWSVYLYKSGDESIKILKSLKYGEPYQVTEKQFNWWLHDTVDWLTGNLLRSKKYDTVLVPKSSSYLLKAFANEIKKLNPKLTVIEEAFMKREIKDIEAEIADLVDRDHPEYKNLNQENINRLFGSIRRELQKAESEGRPKTLTVKNLYKPHQKFLKDFMKMAEKDELIEAIMGKKVLVIDDILSSGSTINDMCRQIKFLDPEMVEGLTLFKRTGV
jgi:pyrimidine operon attenuation protein/uracil phosphoribosyltransferase